MIGSLKIGTLLDTASDSASGKIFTPNAKTAPTNGSLVFTTDASITSRLLISPMSAMRTGTLLALRISAKASKEPSVSAFIITPSIFFVILILPISSVMSLQYFAGFSPEGTANNGAPAKAPSKSGATIFTPADA